MSINDINKIIQGDTLIELKKFPDNFVDTIITSPPYWGLRDYGVEGQIGLEKTLEEFTDKLLVITIELKRVLKPTGVMFWNHGDCYGGSWQNYGSRNGGQREKKSESFPRKDNPSEEIPPTAGLTSKCLVLQNYRLILKMIDEQGWILRNTIVWHKSNHMPSSVKDRFANSYEPVFMLVKNKKYWFDLDAVRKPHQGEFKPFNIRERKGKAVGFMASPAEQNKRKKFTPKMAGGGSGVKNHKGYYDESGKLLVNPAGKNPGDVWKLSTQPFPEAHFATFPEKLVEPMILSSCPKNGIVLDPFMGSGTVAYVARKLRRNYLGIELSPEYIKLAEDRLRQEVLL